MRKPSDANPLPVEGAGHSARPQSVSYGERKGPQRKARLSSATAANPVQPCRCQRRLWLAAGGSCERGGAGDASALGPVELQEVTRALVDHAERERAREGQQERLRRGCLRLQLRLGFPERSVH